MLAALIAALLAVAPSYLDDASAYENARAASLAAKEYGVDVTVVLAIGYIESRYDGRALSRRECVGDTCKRVTGRWDGVDPPPGAKPAWYCGVMQVGGDVPWERCQLLRTDLTENYRDGAKHLRRWMRDPSCRNHADGDRLRCALQGYSGVMRRSAQVRSSTPTWSCGWWGGCGASCQGRTYDLDSTECVG
jgi:hypothetical protein